MERKTKISATMFDKNMRYVFEEKSDQIHWNTYNP